MYAYCIYALIVYMLIIACMQYIPSCVGSALDHSPGSLGSAPPAGETPCAAALAGWPPSPDHRLHVYVYKYMYMHIHVFTH